MNNSEIDFLESLKENDSIQFSESVEDWKQAINKTFIPLIEQKCVTKKYPQNIVKSVINNGPYFIICPKVAMPHSRPEDGVLKNSFSLLILKKPVDFDENQKIQILIGFAAVDSQIHLQKALPQIVAIFEDEKMIEKMLQTSNKTEILNLISTIDYWKYIRKEN